MRVGMRDGHGHIGMRLPDQACLLRQHMGCAQSLVVPGEADCAKGTVHMGLPDQACLLTQHVGGCARRAWWCRRRRTA